MVGLPPEIIPYIATQLHELHPPSVWSLALANKTCHAAASPGLFRNICLRVRGWPSLCDDVTRLSMTLSRNAAHRHVLSLSIKGKFALPSEIGLFQSHCLVDRAATQNALAVGGAASAVFPGHDAAWMPVAELIAALPHLADMSFGCPSPIPGCILEALHGKDPLPRLSVETFRFRTSKRNPILPVEMALATSPCLHSITVTYLRWGNVRVDYNRDAVMRMVAGMAPNLREVRMVEAGRGHGASPDLYAYSTTPAFPWRGFPGVAAAYITPGRLTSLSLSGHMRLEMLQVWTEQTNFTLLRTLQLETCLKTDSLEWLSRNCTLPSLTELGLKVSRSDRPYEELVGAVMTFLSGLPPLKMLSLSGDVETQLLDLALLEQGASLSQLKLGPLAFENPTGGRGQPAITEIAVQRVGERCPKLRDLTMYIRRTKSDAAEVAIYRAFGRMASLKKLSLYLDCSNYGLSRHGDYEPTGDDDSSFDEFEKEPFHGEDASTVRNGHVRDVFLNCAMDEPLARSIWATISGRKTGVPLQSLRLEPVGGTKLGPPMAAYVYRHRVIQITGHLSRVYLLERVDYGGEGEDVVSVRDPNQATREAMDDRCRPGATSGAALSMGEKDDPLTMATMRVFRSIWPEQEGSMDWRDDWSSLPLQSKVE